MSILKKIFGFGKKEAAPETVDTKVTEINSAPVAPYKVEPPVAEEKTAAPPPIVKAENTSTPAKVAPVKKATPKAPAAPRKKTTKTK